MESFSFPRTVAADMIRDQSLYLQEEIQALRAYLEKLEDRLSINQQYENLLAPQRDLSPARQHEDIYSSSSDREDPDETDSD
jgi:hypothetical protein